MVAPADMLPTSFPLLLEVVRVFEKPTSCLGGDLRGLWAEDLGYPMGGRGR